MVERPEHLAEDTAIYEDDGEVFGIDDRGEFRVEPPQGNSSKLDGRCNAVLRYSKQRYGEIRYCGMLPVGTFGETNYEHDDWCKMHQSRQALMERAIELIQHGYFGRNYVLFEKSLDATEFAFAVSMFAGLLDTSRYDFDVEVVERTIDASDDGLIERDEILLQLPIPQTTRYQTQASELWFLALDEIVEQRMQNIRLEQGVDSDHVVATADEDGVITDRITERSESHLNLPISRLSTDKKDRFRIGGVEIGSDDDEGTITFSANEYVLDMSDEAPEAMEMDGTLTEQVTEDDEE